MAKTTLLLALLCKKYWQDCKELLWSSHVLLLLCIVLVWFGDMSFLVLQLPFLKITLGTCTDSYIHICTLSLYSFKPGLYEHFRKAKTRAYFEIHKVTADTVLCIKFWNESKKNMVAHVKSKTYLGGSTATNLTNSLGSPTLISLIKHPALHLLSHSWFHKTKKKLISHFNFVRSLKGESDQSNLANKSNYLNTHRISYRCFLLPSPFLFLS